MNKKYVDLTAVQAEELLKRIAQNKLTDKDRELCSSSIDLVLWLQNELRESKLSIKRLRSLFGMKTEKKKSAANETAAGDDDGRRLSEGDPYKTTSERPKKPGHGRHSADHYVDAEVKSIAHPDFTPGSACPIDWCDGKVYRFSEPSKIIRLLGSGLAHVVKYELEKWRCNLCLTVFTAPLPKEAGSDKYTNGFKAVLAVNHYYMGQPFYRIARYQESIGAPIPESNQFACMEKLVGCVLPVYRQLLQLAAEAQHLNIDDTTMRIQSLIQENKQRGDNERKGIFSTAMIAKINEHSLNLVVTGRKHAGENLSMLLETRQKTTEKMLLMCDALSRNIPSQKNLKALLMICYCLVHARRNFFEIRDEYRIFCDHILDCFAVIYQNEMHCKLASLSSHARLHYHRSHSRAAIKSLYRSCLDELRQKKVEPNSSLGKAMLYMIKHRRELTRFLRIPGVELDNNNDERLIKKIIRYRKNSLSYYNEYGAFVGDVLMSLILTTISTEGHINPVHYLTALQDHAFLVQQNPKQWLPWNYQATLNVLESAKLDTG